MHKSIKTILVFGVLISLEGCAIQEIAVNKLADTLSEGGGVYASDDDIELVGEALPFSLKTIEALLQEVPEHKGLLLTAASGFTQYSYAYVYLDSLEIEDSDPIRSSELRMRAKRLYLRGNAYALRAVELTQANFVNALRSDPEYTLSIFTADNVPELYWFSLSLAAAISADKSDVHLIADLNLIEPIMQRCLQLDESYEQGALHEFMIAYQGGRTVLQGGGTEAARHHFDRAMALSHSSKVAPLVTLAETTSVAEQDREEFERLLTEALDFDVDLFPDFRLANLVAQKRARLLEAQSDDLFLEE